jgi:hypothetical protein
MEEGRRAANDSVHMNDKTKGGGTRRMCYQECVSAEKIRNLRVTR